MNGRDSILWAPHSAILKVLRELVFKVKAKWEKSLLCALYFYFISYLLTCFGIFSTALSPVTYSSLCIFPLLIFSIPHFIAPLFHTGHSRIFCHYPCTLVFGFASLSFCQKEPNLLFMVHSRYSQSSKYIPFTKATGPLLLDRSTTSARSSHAAL